MELVAKAAKVAAYAHRLQHRKYPNSLGFLDPYIVHPSRVAGSALVRQDSIASRIEMGLDEFVAAAWLHDVIEDTRLDVFYLEQMFPWPVVRTVVGMTKQFAESDRAKAYLEQGRMISEMTLTGNREERKSAELDYLGRQSPAVHILKALDRLDNLGEITTGGRSFALQYAEESMALVEVIRNSVPRGIVAELERAISKIRQAS